MRWPTREEVLAAARTWAQDLRQRAPEVQAVIVTGSVARGDYGVGSDLDLILILSDSTLPMHERYTRYYPDDLPVPADLSVYTQSEWDALPDHSPALWQRLQRERLDI